MNIPEYENYHENKIHADSLFPYNTYICSIPLDFKEVPNHWHDEMEIIYIKKGRGIVTFELMDHFVQAGDIIIVLPGQIHGIRQSASDSMEYENIIFSTNMFLPRLSDGIETEFFHPLLSGKLSIYPFVTQSDDYYKDIVSCLDQADSICTSFPKGYKLALKSILYQFFYVLYQNATEASDVTRDKSLDRMREIIKYIEENYHHTITIEEAAATVGFSSSHFMKFFKKESGTSFIDYLNNYRLSMATRLLISSSGSILEIAQSCGFENLSYFNRIFKKRYQMTPKEYRNSFVQF